jgi:hypothetical protein
MTSTVNAAMWVIIAIFLLLIVEFTLFNRRREFRLEIAENE